MKIFLLFFVCIFLNSCSETPGSNRQTDQLNDRATVPEPGMDSLTNAGNIDSFGTNSPGIVLVNARCQAFTKKGTQCKRKARNNTYCWQHGGE